MTCVGPPGRKADAVGHPASFIGNQIRPAHADVAAADEGQGQIIEPVFIGFAVAVGVDDDLARGGVHADVAGVAQAHVFLADVADPGEFLEDFLGVVGAAIVDEDHFKIGIAQFPSSAGTIRRCWRRCRSR
jgi:hypothetical protein